MDKNHAKFILQSFRADGSDANDPAFAEALAFAAQDRETGAWLANERAQDAAFATALASIEIPESLYTSLLTLLDKDRHLPFDEVDADLVGAFTAIQPPVGLRDEILHAMSQETATDSSNSSHSENKTLTFPLRRFSQISAIAATIVLGIWAAFSLPLEKSNSPQESSGDFAQNTFQQPFPENQSVETTLVSHQVTSDAVEKHAAQFLNNKFSLDVKNDNYEHLSKFLTVKNLPVPKDLPEKLTHWKLIGCRQLDIQGVKASLICFSKNKTSVLHLVVIERDQVKDSHPPFAEITANSHRSSCRTCVNCRRKKPCVWSTTRWSDNGYSYHILAKMKPTDISRFL